ncbi:MAG: NlpC/P60 family protein [Gordonia amarae]
MINLLIAPLHTLVDALGTGVLPPDNPVTRLRTTAQTLAEAEKNSAAATTTVLKSWSGDGARGMATQVNATTNAATTFTADTDSIATIVDDAAGKVATAAKQLDTLVDSFGRTVSTLGGNALTVSGLALLVPVAIDHVSRGVQIVEKTRTQLESDSARLRAVTRAQTKSTQTGSTPTNKSTPATITQVQHSTSPVTTTPYSTSTPGTSAPGTTTPSTTTPSTTTTGANRQTPIATTSQDTPTFTTAASTRTTGSGIPITLPDGSVAYAPNQKAATAVTAALSKQGTPYMWGGTSTGGFDCSGFTQWAYRQAGVELPRLAQDQDTVGRQVSQDDLQPGDLAVWSGHVAMYIGNGQLIETGGAPVSVTQLRTTNSGQNFEGFYRVT